MTIAARRSPEWQRQGPATASGQAVSDDEMNSLLVLDTFGQVNW